MAEVRGKRSGGAVTKRYEEPVTLGEVIQDLPATGRESKIAGVVDAVVEATKNGGWVALATGGRKNATVQSSVQSAAARRGIRMQTRLRDGQVYARVRPAGSDEGDVEAGTDEDE